MLTVQEQCSALSETYLALPLMIVKEVYKAESQRDAVNVYRVESGDENKEANGTTNVGLTILTAMQRSS